jgi:hypothetical protein
MADKAQGGRAVGASLAAVAASMVIGAGGASLRRQQEVAEFS